MPSGPGVIPEARISEIAAVVPPGVARFLLTSRRDASGIADQQRRCGVDTIQLCDALADDAYRDLREAMPGVSLVQVIHVTDGQIVVREAVVSELALPTGTTRAYLEAYRSNVDANTKISEFISSGRWEGFKPRPLPERRK